jgi:hypothetical protein
MGFHMILITKSDCSFFQTTINQLVFKPGASHVGFVVDKVVLGQVFSEYGFPC